MVFVHHKPAPWLAPESRIMSASVSDKPTIEVRPDIGHTVLPFLINEELDVDISEWVPTTLSHCWIAVISSG